MLYNIVTELVSQQMVFHELLKKTSIHMWSVIHYAKCSFLLVASLYIFTFFCYLSYHREAIVAKILPTLSQ